jgi:hypothetical protein
MDQQKIFAEMAPHYADFINLAELERRPLLAHYTSLSAIENISKGNDLLFSNPLFMNDTQEIRFGMNEGYRIFLEEFSEVGRGDKLFSSGFSAVRDAFVHNYKIFEYKHALNIYVFCLSQHGQDDNDGKLSMWRGYGGNGCGAVIVFNTDFVSLNPASPLLIAKVIYSTDDERREWIRRVVQKAKKIVTENNLDQETAFFLGSHIFDLVKIHSVMSKHCGFIEEQEWRIIYLPERDVSNILSGGFTYVVGKGGIEPKLRFPIRPLPIEGAVEWTFESIVDRIILGPSLSSFLEAVLKIG